MNIAENVQRAVDAVRDADALFISSGAGMGVDSGLPDFRGDKGFWKAYPPIAKLGIRFYEMADPRWFHENPNLAWGFYGHRLNLYRRTVPHQGFNQLLELAQEKKGGYFAFTSNVDGQFQMAGFDDARIEECHGSIHHFQCSGPCGSRIWDGEDFKVDINEETFEAYPPLPECPDCGAVARPNILMFGDWSWIQDRTESQSRHLQSWLHRISTGGLSVAIIEVGAGEAVPTVRMNSEYIARLENATLIRINPRDYDVPGGHISIPLNGAEGINRIYTGVM